MTNIQRAFCVFLSLIFLCVMAALTGDFFKHGEIYRQLPLYCFLEKKALQEETGRDRETEMLLQEKNAEHLGEEVEVENRKEQEALLIAEAEEAEKKEEKQKKEVQKSEEKSADSTENKKDTGVENKEPEITKPEITQMEITPAGSDAAEKKASVEKTVKEQETVAVPHPQIDLSPAKLADFDYVMNQFFIPKATAEDFARKMTELQGDASEPRKEGRFWTFTGVPRNQTVKGQAVTMVNTTPERILIIISQDPERIGADKVVAGLSGVTPEAKALLGR